MKQGTSWCYSGVLAPESLQIERRGPGDGVDGVRLGRRTGGMELDSSGQRSREQERHPRFLEGAVHK